MPSEAFKSHYPTAYGIWAGNSAGRKPDFTRCCAEVRSPDGWALSQCARKNGHGPDGAYCKQHDPVAVAERERAARERFENEQIQERFRLRGKSFAKALKRIADGDNDPRTVAREALGDLYGKVDES